MEAPPSPLSSRPELRTRISYFALLARSTCAALLKESRMKSIHATGLHRKFGGKPFDSLPFRTSASSSTQPTFRPSLVNGIASYVVDMSVEATAHPSLKGTGPGPYLTQRHLNWLRAQKRLGASLGL